MERARGETSPRRRGRHGASAPRQAADPRAAALASTIRALMAAGFASQRALMDELNRRGIPAAHGGKWHRTSVARVLIRLGLIKSGHGNDGRALKRAADVRAEALGLTIRELRNAGFSVEAIARELNERKVPTPLGAKWHRNSVGRLLHRLERLERSSRTAVTPATDAEPKSSAD